MKIHHNFQTIYHAHRAWVNFDRSHDYTHQTCAMLTLNVGTLFSSTAGLPSPHFPSWVLFWIFTFCRCFFCILSLDFFLLLFILPLSESFVGHSFSEFSLAMFFLLLRLTFWLNVIFFFCIYPYKLFVVAKFNFIICIYL